MIKTITNLAVAARSFIEAFLELRKSEPDLLESVATNAQITLVAFEKKDAEFRVSGTIFAESVQPAFDEANQAVAKTLGAAKKVLLLKAGSRSSSLWHEAGYRLSSTRTPVKWEERVLLLENLSKFFQSRPEWENADYGVTSVNLLALAKRLHQAAQAKKLHETAHRQLVQERDDLAARLRTRLSAMRGELRHVLAGDDIRWKEFNLPVPAESKSVTQQTAREQKKQDVETARQDQRLRSGMDRLLKARLRGEKLRARYDRMLIELEGIKAEVENSLAEISEAEAKVVSLGGTVTMVASSTSEKAPGARQMSLNPQAVVENAAALVA